MTMASTSPERALATSIPFPPARTAAEARSRASENARTISNVIEATHYQNPPGGI